MHITFLTYERFDKFRPFNSLFEMPNHVVREVDLDIYVFQFSI